MSYQIEGWKLQQATFTLFTGQVETFKETLRQAEKHGPFAGVGSENSNDNGLARGTAVG
ncbi:hypothetical protein [Planctomicrobium sp. SH527]|uniref:hypothetical protein n=1 Tax=Planctomicrobium sp. SH527 TaxID=3448123 RepID=UPI003F5C3A42